MNEIQAIIDLAKQIFPNVITDCKDCNKPNRWLFETAQGTMVNEYDLFQDNDGIRGYFYYLDYCELTRVELDLIFGRGINIVGDFKSKLNEEIRNSFDGKKYIGNIKENSLFEILNAIEPIVAREIEN
jgi:hypothetical protein